MNSAIQLKIQKKVRMPVPVEGLVSTLHDIQLKIDAAAGAATALELRLRIIAQLSDNVRVELRKKTSKPFYKAHLEDIISAVLKVFEDNLDSIEREKITNCRLPRNKTSHASFAGLMISLNGEALGREIDPHTLKRKPIEEDEIIEGAICIGRNGGLEEFSKRAREAIFILEDKILRSCLSYRDQDED